MKKRVLSSSILSVRWHGYTIHCKENLIYVYAEKELRGISPNSYIDVTVSDFIFPGSVHIFGCSKIDRPILEIINLSQIYECKNWKKEHYNSFLEITRLHGFISRNT